MACDRPADCWHLTGDDIEAALAEFNEQQALTPDGEAPSPSLPANWSAVSRTDRRVFQCWGIDYFVVLGNGTEERLIILCAQGNRAYPAPLDHRTLSVGNDPTSAVQEFVAESNDLVEPERRRMPDGESSPLLNYLPADQTPAESLERIGRELERYIDWHERTAGKHRRASSRRIVTSLQPGVTSVS